MDGDGEEDGDRTELHPISGSHEESFTCYLFFCILTCVVGTSFQFGYSTGVINAPGEDIKEFINDSSVERHGSPMSEKGITLIYAIIVAIWAVGGMIGGLAAGPLMERCGRRGCMLLNNIGFVLGALLTMFGPRATSYEMMIFGRLLSGISCGIATGVAPVYLSEISPVTLRGAIGTVHQLVIVVAVFTSQVLGLTELLGSASLWPYLFGFPLIPAALQLMMLPFCMESPEYLYIHQNNIDEATKALTRLRGNQSNVEAELGEMRLERQHQETTNVVTICGLVENGYLRHTLLIAVMMQLSQQFSGINGVIYYSDGLFLGIGFSNQSARYATLGVTSVLLLTTLVSVFLVDRAGRRILHLTGLAGMAISASVLTLGFALEDHWSDAGYLSIAATGGFVMSFALGPGSIPWFMVAELFAQNARSAAMSVAVVTNWLANFVVAQTFPFLQEYLSSYVFVPFVCLLLVFFLLTYFYVPETKGKTIEEIQREMRASDGHGLYTNMDHDEPT